MLKFLCPLILQNKVIELKSRSHKNIQMTEENISGYNVPFIADLDLTPSIVTKMRNAHDFYHRRIH